MGIASENKVLLMALNGMMVASLNLRTTHSMRSIRPAQGYFSRMIVASLNLQTPKVERMCTSGSWLFGMIRPRVIQIPAPSIPQLYLHRFR
jgi:hypothetical protein